MGTNDAARGGGQRDVRAHAQEAKALTELRVKVASMKAEFGHANQRLCVDRREVLDLLDAAIEEADRG